ncbi:MAG: hypothetical protein ACR2O3_15310 [Rhizobiaceae bacterium]
MMKLFYAILILALSVRPSYAYIDPVTGSVVVQVLVGAVAAGFVAFKSFQNKIIALVRGQDKQNDTDKTDK